MRVKHRLERMANGFLGRFGLEIVRRSDRAKLSGVLRQVKKAGFLPRSVLDVGAANGTFELYEAFPDARHLLIEPLEEHRAALDRIVRQFAKVEYVIAAASRKAGTMTLNVHPDLDGSSLYIEVEEPDVNGVPRTVPVITLDEVCAQRGIEGPFLLKVDVQGAELDVLDGSHRVFQETEVVILEVSLISTTKGPELHEILKYMHEHGFVTYDIFNPIYRPLDGALCQVDICFVKADSRFRQFRAYATEEQRGALSRGKRNR